MIIETNDYWICSNNLLIFKPRFNRQLDEKLLSKYTHIIFSNYIRPQVCMRQENKFSTKCDYEYIGSSFNQPFNIASTLILLSFGSNFNQPVNLPSSLTYLTFGSDFNQPVNLPSSLIHLSFGTNFNQPVNLPDTIRYLTIGYAFSYEINLPLGLKYLSLDTNNQYILDNFVDTIEELELNCNFNLELNNLPNSIQKIIFNNYEYDKDLNSLADSVRFIKLPKKYNKKLDKVPKSLKVIVCDKDYPFLNDYEQHIKIFN
jgi:hypothetical protein